jgi:hypothetical protein
MQRLYPKQITSKILTLPYMTKRTDVAPGLGDNQASLGIWG